MPPKGLAVDDLLLDSENPRIGTAESQRDALQRIIDDQGEKLYELADDIVSEGLSPIDRLLVLRESDSSKSYIALEGNRRVAALKILSNPNLLTGLDLKPALKKRFEILASQFDKRSIEPVDAFVVDSRQQGNRWIYLRHTGENQGRGVVGWSGVAAARFRGEDPALQALEFVRKYGELTDSQKNLLGQYFPITTLDRVLSDTEVRGLLGIGVAKNKIQTALPAAEVIKPLRRLVLDLAEKRINVSTLKNKPQRIQYVNSLSPADRADLRKAGKTRDIEAISLSDFGRSQPSSGQKRRRSSVFERKTVVPSRLVLNITNARINGIFQELQRLKAEDTPNAGAVLLRVFLELSVDAYLDKNHIVQTVSTPKGKVDKKLGKKVEECIDHMVTNGGANRKTFQSVARGLNVAHSPFSIDLLHAYVHNRFLTPTPRELISAWNDAQPFFEQIWK